MLLTSTSVVQHLLERDLLAADRVLEGTVRVERANGRNRVFLVRCGEGGFFVKQPERWHPDELASCEREAQILGLRGTALGKLSDLMPPIIDWQPTSRIMVCELLVGCEDLSRHYRLEVKETMAQVLGATTAVIHRETVLPSHEDQGAASMVDVPRAEEPWAFSVDRQAALAGHSGDGYHASIYGRLRTDAQLCNALALSAQRWRANALIHGDLKWSNWLARTNVGRLDELFVVDWEMAGLGDTAWDVAGMLYALVYPHLARGGPPSMSTASSLLRSFVHAYLDATGAAMSHAVPFVERCIVYLGARSVQGVYELPDIGPARATIAEATLEWARSCLMESSSVVSELLGVS